jgi:hypothetical protein
LPVLFSLRRCAIRFLRFLLLLDFDRLVTKAIGGILKLRERSRAFDLGPCCRA